MGHKLSSNPWHCCNIRDGIPSMGRALHRATRAAPSLLSVLRQADERHSDLGVELAMEMDG
jgi:hypothetical protein